MDSSKGQLTIRELRERNLEGSTAIARTLGLTFTEDPNSSTSCVSQDDWPSFRRELQRAGYACDRIQEQHSYAAGSAWSISHTADSGFRGAGALWQVFPGTLIPCADAQDFVGTIDVVYTWVDSSDPKWAADYRYAREQAGRPVDESSTDMARFTSRDELLFSLRSLEMNLPWVNHVYLVTAGQKPAWLAESHPKLTLVDHREIFTDPNECLPTFNSHAIESQLVNIPGLNENFIYVNDDVFFGRYLFPNTFYGPAGQAKYCLATGHFASAANQELPVNRAAANNRELVVERFGRTTSRKFQHVAHPQRMQVLQGIQKLYPERLAQIARQRFRSDTDLSIPSSLAHQFAARLGLGFPNKVNYQYVDIGSDSFYLDMLRLARNPGLDMFCLNEVLKVDDELNRGPIVRDLLESKFPVKSSFEK
ncbi:stealth family protein [Glutamicibacter sp. MNS18]|uniref:stealth family protein n=1 Tax=Glutamicibacter sp. MNS18 TaxID=2989817 RepID=UPI0022361C16|nr:stealth family protein [Glutamicibacter sp. MNS18]MCW4466207.1 stealth family protein [Glutamicibacter sp. MNS18]